jgi:rRNA biogenesis protein RRP5
LQNLFNAGDLVCCRVVSKSLTADEYYVNLSLNPKEVNAHLRSHQICRGFALIGSIKAIEDHGYIIDTGISNSSAFLALKNAKRKTSSIGELVVGCVEKIVSAKEQPTFMLKESSHKTPEPLNLEEPNMDLLFPCSVVEFTVTDHIADGLKGHLFDGLFENVYINAQQLQKASHKIANYEIGSTCQARILYVTNLSKHIHCTLNLEKIKTNAEFSEVIGIVVKEAKVLKTTKRCVFFQWKNEQNETLDGVMNVSETSDSVADKYPVKSKHEIEICDYYLLDHIYKVGLVTDDKWKRIGNVNSMEVGNVMEGVVTMALNLGGYGLKIGRVHGYLHEIDLKPSVFYKKGK